MTLAKRDRRILIAGTAIIAPALLIAFGILPLIRQAQDAGAAVSAERMLLARELGLIEAHGNGEFVAAETRASDFVRTRLIAARDETLLYARAASMIVDIARLSGIALGDAGLAGGGAAHDSMREIELALRGTGELGSVLLFMHRVETSPAVLRVHRVTLTRRDSRDGFGGLDFSLLVTAYGAADQ